MVLDGGSVVLFVLLNKFVERGLLVLSTRFSRMCRGALI